MELDEIQDEVRFSSGTLTKYQTVFYPNSLLPFLFILRVHLYFGFDGLFLIFFIEVTVVERLQCDQ
jgi:hypothetical protein